MAGIIFNTFIASLIPISCGHFLNKFFFKSKNINLFECGIYGFLPIGIIALILNFFFPLSQGLNNLLLIPIFFFIIELFKNGKIYSLLKINFLISILVTIFIAFDTVYRPDAGWYHLPFTKILNDFKIIFGTASFHPMFGVSSILQYISAVFNDSILGDYIVLLPNALIGNYFFGLFISEIFKENTFTKKFFSFFILTYMFIEANRYSEYGNDIPVLFYFLYVIYLFLDIKKYNLSYREIEKISLFSVFAFTIKTFLLFIFLAPFIFFIKNFKKKIFPFIASFFLIFWLIRNILVSGCLIYPVNFTCVNNLDWYSSNPKFQISALNSSQFTELYIKGWYNKKNIIDISEDNYQKDLENKNSFLKNFNWLNTHWLTNNFKNIIKRFDYFIILILLMLLIHKFILKNKLLPKNNYFLTFEIKAIFLIGLVGTSVFFYKFPDGRYGASYLLITLFCIFINFFEKTSFPESIKKINKSLVSIILSLLCLVMITKSIIRINSNYNNTNSAWPNIYDLDNPNNGKAKFEFVEKNGLKIFFSSSDNLKIVHKNLCAYNNAPCTPTKNYLNQFDIEKNNFGYLTLKLKK